MSHPHLAFTALDLDSSLAFPHASLRNLIAAGGRGGVSRAGGKKGSENANNIAGMGGLEFVLFIAGLVIAVLCCSTLIFAWWRSRRIRLGYIPKPTKVSKHGKAKRKVRPRTDDIAQPTLSDSDDEGVALDGLAQPKLQVMGPPRPHLYPAFGERQQEQSRDRDDANASRLQPKILGDGRSEFQKMQDLRASSPRPSPLEEDARTEFQKLQDMRASSPRPIVIGGEPPSHGDAVDEFQRMQRLRKFTPPPGGSSAPARKASPPAGAVRQTSPPPGAIGARQPTPPAGAVRTAPPPPTGIECVSCLAVDAAACACCPAGVASDIY